METGVHDAAGVTALRLRFSLALAFFAFSFAFFIFLIDFVIVFVWLSFVLCPHTSSVCAL